MSSPCSLHQSITLSDGRVLAYADIGHEDDFPVFYFHGFPGSRVEAGFSREVAPQVGARVISVERPGYGQSSFHEKRTISDWPGDVIALADALGIEKFSILGVSAGGVYALACASHIPERLLNVGIACTPAPVEATAIRREMDWVSRIGFHLAHDHSMLGDFILGRLLGLLVKYRTELFLKLISLSAAAADRDALNDRQFRDAVSVSLREAYRAGHKGPFYDLHLVSCTWDFDLQQIQRPVHLWHGKADTVVPVAMGKYLAEQLADCQTYLVDDEGHFSITVNYMEQALHTLMQVEQNKTASNCIGS